VTVRGRFVGVGEFYCAFCDHPVGTRGSAKRQHEHMLRRHPIHLFRMRKLTDREKLAYINLHV
jgi:hypothetical protein